MLARHPDEGAHLAAPLTPWLGDWLRGVRDHHERWDGNGYPDGIAGPDISLAGRIVCVTDAFETMTAVRSYKRPMSAASARRELVACSGSHFDPHIVRAFLDVSLGRLWWILGPVSWLALVPLLGRLPRAAAATNAARHSGRVVGGLRTAGIALVTAGAVTSLALGHPSPDQTAAPRQIASPTTAAAPLPTAPAGTPAAPVTAPSGPDASNTTGAGAGAATGTPPAGTDLVAAPAPGVTTPPPDPAGPAPLSGSPPATGPGATPPLLSVTVGPGVDVTLSGRPLVSVPLPTAGGLLGPAD